MAVDSCGEEEASVDVIDVGDGVSVVAVVGVDGGVDVVVGAAADDATSVFVWGEVELATAVFDVTPTAASAPANMWNGNEYWNVLGSESRIISKP